MQKVHQETCLSKMGEEAPFKFILQTAFCRKAHVFGNVPSSVERVGTNTRVSRKDHEAAIFINT